MYFHVFKDMGIESQKKGIEFQYNYFRSNICNYIRIYSSIVMSILVRYIKTFVCMECIIAGSFNKIQKNIIVKVIDLLSKRFDLMLYLF